MRNYVEFDIAKCTADGALAYFTDRLFDTPPKTMSDFGHDWFIQYDGFNPSVKYMKGYVLLDKLNVMKLICWLPVSNEPYDYAVRNIGTAELFDNLFIFDRSPKGFWRRGKLMRRKRN